MLKTMKAIHALFTPDPAQWSQLMLQYDLGVFLLENKTITQGAVD